MISLIKKKKKVMTAPPSPISHHLARLKTCIAVLVDIYSSLQHLSKHICAD